RLRLDLPEEVSVSAEADNLLVSPKHAWPVGERVIPSGALVRINLDRFISGARDFEIVFTPTPTRSLESWLETRHGIVLQILDNVRGRIVLARRGGDGWVETSLPHLPDNASISAASFGGEDDPDLGAEVLLTVT